MKEVDYPDIEKIGMFRDSPFDPVTKERRSKPSNFNCKIDTRYDTGLIICNEEPDSSSIWKVLVSTFVIVVFALFSFSMEIEVSHLDELPIVVFFLEKPHVTVIIISSVVAFAVLMRFRRR